MRNCSDDERILDLFTKVSHHCDVTCIYLTQNLFPPGKFTRSISLNAHYIVAFNNPRDTLGFRTLVQQAFAGNVPYVWESLQDATSNPFKFGYLVLDLHPRTPNIQRLRTRILPTTHSYLVIYVDKNSIKQRTHCLRSSVNMMTSYKSRRTVKGKRKNQRGENMVLRSGTTTRSKGISIESVQECPISQESNNIYHFFVPVSRTTENSGKR